MKKVTMFSEFCFAVKIMNIHTGEVYDRARTSFLAPSGLYVKDHYNNCKSMLVDFRDYVPVEYFHNSGKNVLQVTFLNKDQEEVVVYDCRLYVRDTHYMIKGKNYNFDEYTLLYVRARKSDVETCKVRIGGFKYECEVLRV